MKTEKGTDLPILNLRGKDYLEVKYRIVWFREVRPEWSIETEFVSVKDTSALAKATIKDYNGRIVATSHKFEDKQGFADFLEKAETGAIGRALALCGFGTQFCADELDEGERIVDSPVAPKSAPKDPVGRTLPSVRIQQPPADGGDGTFTPGNFVVPVGKPQADGGMKGMKLKDIDRTLLIEKLDWIELQASKPLGRGLEDMLKYGREYISSTGGDPGIELVKRALRTTEEDRLADATGRGR